MGNRREKTCSSEASNENRIVEKLREEVIGEEEQQNGKSEEKAENRDLQKYVIP